MKDSSLTVGLAQFAPVLLKKDQTLERALAFASDAASRGCDLVVLGGEAAVGGYPAWLEISDAARFNSPVQKDIFAEYSAQAVVVERGDLDGVCKLARERRIAIYLGIVEKPADRGETLYASLVYVDRDGAIQSVHRKLVPTYEERLVWGNGDGHGLRVHALGDFTVGGLNCWENWNPLARAALYAQGEDFHVCVFPGGRHNVEVTKFIAQESRSYCASVCSLVRKSDFPDDFPHREAVLSGARDVMYNGGTCLAGPDGEWVVEPLGAEEKLAVAELDHAFVRRERQNMDMTGHYTRPDVLQLLIDRERQTILREK